LSPLEQVVLAGHCLGHAARLVRRPALWAPWMPVLALQLAAVGALWWFAHPAVSWLVAPAIQALAGEPALHYPEAFRFMPALYARADLAIAILVAAVATGASTAMFGAQFAGQPLSAGLGLGRGWSKAGVLVLANLPLTLLVVGFAYGLDAWLQSREGLGLVRRLAPWMTLATAVVLQAFFVWVNPLVMIGGRRLVDAWRELPEAAARGGWTGLALAAAAAAPLVPLQLLARGADKVVERGTPELVGWWLVAQVLVGLLAAFVLAGGSTLAYSSLVGPELEDES
jgi:hypothetical protein